MHPFFAGLDPYEVALLLVALTVGGDDGTRQLGLLAEPLQAKLAERARALDAMAPEVRHPLLLAELKATLQRRGHGSLERVDPTWLVHKLRGESPRVVGLILLGLSAPTLRNALRRLPNAVRRQLPAKSELNAVAPDLAAELRRSFAARFRPMPEPRAEPKAVRDVLFLDRVELYRLVRDLGFVELGQAFAAIEKMALVELCRRLDKQDAHELIAAVQSASQVEQIDPKVAQHFLSKVVVNFEDTEEFLQKSGLWRLARATLAEPAEWQQAMVQRLPRRVGLLFAEHLARARELPQGEDEAARARLQDAILVHLQRMARAGRIAPSWTEGPFAYHDEAACVAALQAPQGAPAPTP